MKDMCGVDLGRGRPECTQTQAVVTGAASCACNSDWADKDSDGDRSARVMNNSDVCCLILMLLL